MHTPKNGRPDAMYSRTGSTMPCSRRLRIVSAAAPTPGTISASAVAHVVRVGRHVAARSPTCATARATLRRFPAP